MSKPNLALVPQPPLHFNRIGCVFHDDEGYVSYGDSSGTEISALDWPEAVELFRIWWEERRAWNAHQSEVGARRVSIREAGR